MTEEYVYRRVAPGEALDVAVPEGMRLVCIASPGAALKHFSALRAQFGFRGAAKAVLKTMAGRLLAACLHKGRIASYVWSAPRSSKYAIEAGTCVLGPLLTRAEMRGRGLGTAVLRKAVAYLARRGVRAFYIDTTAANVASQRTIARAGFTRCGTITGGVYRPDA
jgi:GNAT superfamily N-acetyltransferase